MTKQELYKSELLKTLTQDDYTVEITEVKTHKEGVACTNKQDVSVVFCFYGKENGDDDCSVSFEEFCTRFKIDRVVDEQNWVAYNVVNNKGDYQLAKEELL